MERRRKPLYLQFSGSSHLEYRRKRNGSSEQPLEEWRHGNITGYTSEWFGERIYGMFAQLADVRNYWRDSFEPIEYRGFPEDACTKTKLGFYEYKLVPDDTTDEEIERIDDLDSPWQRPIRRKSTIDEWVKDCGCKTIVINGETYCQSPDWHSPNWCTTEEMEKCVKFLFNKGEDKPCYGTYHEWYALLYAMKGYEADGETECRAVFWFDN